MSHLAVWVLHAMLMWVPPSIGELPRYESMAEDFVKISNEAPIFAGEDRVEKTAIYLAAISSFESFYRVDVDAFEARGDGGKAWGLFQVHLLPGERCDSRLRCMRIGRERIRQSFKKCEAFPHDEQLSLFMTGQCMHNPDSRYRMFRAKSWWRRFPYQRLELNSNQLVCKLEGQ